MKKEFEVACRVAVAGCFISASVVTIAVIKDGFPGNAATFAWDGLKTVVGPFVGAALAFYANNYFHKERKADSDLAAAMAALFSVNALHDDFLNYRFAWRTHLAKADERFTEARNTNAPIWTYSRPMMFAFRDNGFPNLDALQFLLLTDAGRNAYHYLQGVERAYRDIREAHKVLNETTLELQTAYAAAGGPSADPEAVTRAIGARVLRGVETLLIGVVDRIEKDEVLYRRAYSELHAAAQEHFSALPVQQVVQKEKFKVENLPALPKIFIERL